MLFLRRKSGGEAQDREWRQPDEKHCEFHEEARNDQRLIALKRLERLPHDSLNGHVRKLGTRFFPRRRTAISDLGKFGVHRPWAKRGHRYAGAA